MTAMPNLEELKTMPAGGRLDGLVHELVMGLPEPCVCGPAPNGYDPDTGVCRRCSREGVARPYSTDPGHAWAAAKKIVCQSGVDFDVCCWSEWLNCKIVGLVPGLGTDGLWVVESSVDSPRLMPLAVSRAAVMAVVAVEQCRRKLS